MQKFSLLIKYKKGLTNKIADFLSRPPKIMTTLTTIMKLHPFPVESLHVQYEGDKDFCPIVVAL